VAAAGVSSVAMRRGLGIAASVKHRRHQAQAAASLTSEISLMNRRLSRGNRVMSCARNAGKYDARLMSMA